MLAALRAFKVAVRVVLVQIRSFEIFFKRPNKLIPNISARTLCGGLVNRLGKNWPALSIVHLGRTDFAIQHGLPTIVWRAKLVEVLLGIGVFHN